MLNKIMPLYFRIGEFIADLLLNGIIHPDLKLNNLGVRQNLDIVTTDFADVKFFKYPEELNIENIRMITQSLFTIIRNSGFEDISWLRCGFTCRGGHIANIIFNNSINNGLCSFNFLKEKDIIEKFNFELDDKDFILAFEWKEIDFSSIFFKYLSLSEFENLEIRKNLRNLNKYYFNLYYLIVYYYFFMKQKISENESIILINIGISAYVHKKIIVAYGILLKCKLYGKYSQKIFTQCEHILNIINNEKNNLISLIRKTIDEAVKYDIPQLLWILEDLELKYLQ